jgi:uncharacterized protein (TIGR02147 family)
MLVRIHPEVRLLSFLSYAEYLGALYEHMKAQRSDYTYYQFSEDLGFSRSSAVSRIVDGRRKLLKRSALRIIDALQLKGIDRRYLLALARANNARLPEEREAFFQELAAIQQESLPTAASVTSFEYLSEWFHPVIREMARLPDFEATADWIVPRLYNRLLPRQISKSLTILESLGLIARDPGTGRMQPAAGPIRPEDVAGAVEIVRYHQKMIDLGREAITQVPDDERDINALTLTLSQEGFEQARAILLKACQDIAALEEVHGPPDRVTQVNVQLFPLTRRSKS